MPSTVNNSTAALNAMRQQEQILQRQTENADKSQKEFKTNQTRKADRSVQETKEAFSKESKKAAEYRRSHHRIDIRA